MAPPSDHERLRLLEAALEQTRAAACITTAELDAPGPEIVYVNPAYLEMTGRSREEVIGTSPRIMQGPLTDRAELDRLRSDLEAGRRFTGETVNYRADGTPFIISWRIDPVLDAGGAVTHYVATQADVTDERRAERLLEALAAIDRGHTDAVRDPGGPEDDLRRVASAVAEALARVVPWGEPTAGGSLVLPTGRLGTGRRPPHLVAGPVLEDDRVGFVAGGPGHWVWAVTGPLAADERAFVDDRALATLADRAGLVVGALAEFERRRTEAMVLQRRLLPPGELVVPGFSVAARFRPGAVGAEVGGDWYAVYPLDGGQSAVAVGDVAGDGVVAAAEMGRVRLVLERALSDGAGPGRALSVTGDWCAAEGVFATACVVATDPTGRLVVASAGHPRPLLVTGIGAEPVAMAVGPPLGVGGVDVPETMVALQPGDALVVVTDGVVERRGEALDVGIERLAAGLAEVDGAAAMARVASNLATGEDDAAVVVLAFGR